MCNVLKFVHRVTERVERMFKVVRPTPNTGVFISQWPPMNRSCWERGGLDYGVTGLTATYIVGEETEANFEAGPGICLFPTKEQAENEIASCLEHNGVHRASGLALLEVEIALGVPLRYDPKYDTYAAPCVKVVCVHRIERVRQSLHI